MICLITLDPHKICEKMQELTAASTKNRLPRHIAQPAHHAFSVQPSGAIGALSNRRMPYSRHVVCKTALIQIKNAGTVGFMPHHFFFEMQPTFLSTLGCSRLFLWQMFNRCKTFQCPARLPQSAALARVGYTHGLLSTTSRLSVDLCCRMITHHFRLGGLLNPTRRSV